MNTSAVRTFRDEARECAMAMLDSGTYIERELPNVRMDEATRSAAITLCSQLVGTKHDIIHELFDLDDLLKEGATDQRITFAITRIMRWLWDDISQLHALVTSLEAAGRLDPEYKIAYVLVAESAVNILNPYFRAQAAADALADPE